MHGFPAAGGGKLLVLLFRFAIMCSLFAHGASGQEFAVAQPRPPASHSGLACASGAERARLQALLKSWQAAYTQWESARSKVEKAKPAYEEAQAQFDEALARERAFPNQLVGIMRGSWSPDLFAASARRDDAYTALHAAADEAERTFNALQTARSADEQLSAEISKRTCAHPRPQSQVPADPQAQPRPAQPQMQPQPCRQAIVSGTLRCL
jgi:hypothetical protein